MHARRRRRSTMQRRSPPPRVIPSLAMPPRLHPSVVVVVVNVFVVVTPSPAGGPPDPSLASDRPSGRETKAWSTSVYVGRRQRPLVVVPPPVIVAIPHEDVVVRRVVGEGRLGAPPTSMPYPSSFLVSHDVAPPLIVALRVRHIVPPPPRTPSVPPAQSSSAPLTSPSFVPFSSSVASASVVS